MTRIFHKAVFDIFTMFSVLNDLYLNLRQEVNSLSIFSLIYWKLVFFLTNMSTQIGREEQREKVVFTDYRFNIFPHNTHSWWKKLKWYVHGDFESIVSRFNDVDI